MSLFPTSGLSRGQNIALLKEHPDLRSVVVSIDWDTAGDRGLDDALSMAALLCGPDGRVRDDGDLVYFNQMISAEASAEHRSTGAVEAEEQIEVDLDRVPGEVAKIVFVLSSDSGAGASRALSRLRGCRVRVADLDTGQQITSTEDFAPGLGEETAVLLGELYRHQGAWKFRAIGQGYSAGIVGVLESFGVGL